MHALFVRCLVTLTTAVQKIQVEEVDDGGMEDSDSEDDDDDQGKEGQFVSTLEDPFLQDKYN